MTEKLYTRVSNEFSTENFNGIIVAGPDLSDSYGFTENGYDTADYEVAPIVVEITPKASNYAQRKDVEAAAERAGIQVWMTKEQYLAEWPDALEEKFDEGVYPAGDVTEPNELLANPDIVRELEAAGFDAFRDFIVVSNTQPFVHCFWRKDTFEASEPLPTVPTDEDYPYDVKLADEPTSAPGM